MHEDLFAQAEMLARVDTRKPKQVNLRRAVSAAYYGVFHYLVDEACRCVFGRNLSIGRGCEDGRQECLPHLTVFPR